MTPYQHEIETLQTAIRQAGHCVLERYNKGNYQIYRKKDRSPVTTVDLEVNDFLRNTILHTYPGDGWLSEEDPDDRTRLTKSRVWILDPLDGTKYFISGIPQFAISIALIENANPVVAVIFNPATNEYFSAVRDHGTFLNDTLVQVRHRSTNRMVLLVNPPALQRGAFRALEHVLDCVPMGSIAYTLALIAAGHADGTINLSRQNEWDIAAGSLLIQEAGGVVLDKSFQPLSFNKPAPYIDGIIAASQDNLNRLIELSDLLPSR